VAYDSQGYLAPGFDLDYQYQIQQPSPLYSASTVSDLTLVGEQQLTPPTTFDSPRPHKKQKNNNNTGKAVNQMAAGDVADAPETAAANKPKRVRTGCLTW
jgi:hypothetical protein